MFGQNATHANFSVDDLAVAKAFYIDKLGFKLLQDREGDFVMEGGGGTKANVYLKDDHKPWDSTVFGIEVADVDQAVKDLADKGVIVEKLPMTDESGIMRDPQMGDAAWFKDPAGNWVCVGNFV